MLTNSCQTSPKSVSRVFFLQKLSGSWSWHGKPMLDIWETHAGHGKPLMLAGHGKLLMLAGHGKLLMPAGYGKLLMLVLKSSCGKTSSKRRFCCYNIPGCTGSFLLQLHPWVAQKLQELMSFEPGTRRAVKLKKQEQSCKQTWLLSSQELTIRGSFTNRPDDGNTEFSSQVRDSVEMVH